MENVKGKIKPTTPSTSNHTKTTIQIIKGILFVNEVETSNPEQIGFAILDIVEENNLQATSSNVQLVFVTWDQVQKLWMNEYL